MAAPQQQYYNFTAGNVPAPNATETIVCTSQKVNSSYAGCTFAIVFAGIFAVGAAATSVTFNVRRGILTGTLVYTGTAIAVVASTSQLIFVACTDQQAGEVASQVYVLTANVAGGAAAGGLTQGYSSVTVAE